MHRYTFHFFAAALPVLLVAGCGCPQEGDPTPDAVDTTTRELIPDWALTLASFSLEEDEGICYDWNDSGGGVVPINPHFDYDGDGCTEQDESDGADPTWCRDCNEADETINDQAEEVCDNIDNDCNGIVDDDTTDAYSGDVFTDNDDDGQFSDEATVQECIEGTLSPPAGSWSDTQGADCDDTDSTVYPGAPENCDSTDSDCDGDVEEGCTIQPSL